MSYRVVEIVTYDNIVICDDCKEEMSLGITKVTPYCFDNRMNGTLVRGWAFKSEDGYFKNYCTDCKDKH